MVYKTPIAIEILLVKQLDKIQDPQIRERIRLSASIITHIQFNSFKCEYII